MAYKEWLRVLKPGGVLYNFDADWMDIYTTRNAADTRRSQQTEAQNVEDYYSGTDIEKMEEINQSMSNVKGI